MAAAASAGWGSHTNELRSCSGPSSQTVSTSRRIGRYVAKIAGVEVTAYGLYLRGLWRTDACNRCQVCSRERRWWTAVDHLPAAWHSAGQGFESPRVRVGSIQTELGAESLPLDRFGVLDPRHLALAKTESRTVLGYMNEMARFCEYAIDDAGGLARCNARELNRELRRELHLSRQPPGYLVPIELAGGSRDRPPLRVVD